VFLARLKPCADNKQETESLRFAQNDKRHSKRIQGTDELTTMVSGKKEDTGCGGVAQRPVSSGVALGGFGRPAARLMKLVRDEMQFATELEF